MPDPTTTMQSAMDESSCWMWTRGKPSGRPHHPGLAGAAAGPISYDESWEEQAFAADSAGGMGGCIWPPRSYSCTFCRREFQSAQALGGHMNVHRRDRALLKLSPAPHIESSHLPHRQQQHHHPNPCFPLAAQSPSQVCSVIYDDSTSPRATLGLVASRSPLSPSRVSVASTQEKFKEHTFVSPFLSTSLIEEKSKRSFFSTTLSLTDQISLGILSGVPELKLGNADIKVKGMGRGEKRVAGKVEEAPSSKRRRIDVAIPFFLDSSPRDDGSPLQSEVPDLKPTLVGELDLELRLGDRPKVK